MGRGGTILKSSDKGVSWKPLGPTTGIASGNQGIHRKSAFSMDIAGRLLLVTPSTQYRGCDFSVDIYSITGRKAFSAVYRAGAERVEIPLGGCESGVYACMATVDGEKAVRSFVLLKNGDASWLPDR